MKSKFVTIASHEFRTPLSTVLSSTSLIKQYKDTLDLEKIEKHIMRIKSSVNHLTSILNDFLSLGKLEEGKVEVISETVTVPHFLEEIKEEVKLSLKEGQNIQIESADYSLLVDIRILRNILFNLISNASKYSEPKRTIWLKSFTSDHRAFFIIRDEGMGIPKQDQRHLFERFFRAANATNIQGSGLGLNIVKRYVDLIGGTINFESSEGIGSTFIVEVPLQSIV